MIKVELTEKEVEMITEDIQSSAHYYDTTVVLCDSDDEKEKVIDKANIAQSILKKLGQSVTSVDAPLLPTTLNGKLLLLG